MGCVSDKRNPTPPTHTREGKESVWHVILFEEPNPTGSRPSDIIELYTQHMKPHLPTTHKGGQGESTEAIEDTRRRQRATRRRQGEERRTENGRAKRRRSSPEKPQVRDHRPRVSVKLCIRIQRSDTNEGC